MGTSNRLSLSAVVELLDGIESRQLYLDYQPMIDLVSGATCGVEALVRWRHPARGAIPPDEFLPAAAQVGLGPMITSYVLDEAVMQWCRWRDAGTCLRMAVNVPPGELTDMTIPNRLSALVDSGLDARCITVEVTERTLAMVTDIEPALDALRTLQVRLSIDDFGTGDSSLSRLRQLHFDEMKLDRTMIDRAADDDDGQRIIRFAADLAHSLGMVVVAEGVERDEELDCLRDCEVDFVQGYYMGRPAPADELQLAYAT